MLFMASNMKCLICDTTCKTNESTADMARYIECPNCGQYYMERDVWEILEGKSSFRQTQSIEIGKAKSTLFYYMRVIHRNHLDKYDHTTIIKYQKSPETVSRHIISFIDIYTLYPKDFTTRVQMTMELWGTVITDIGEHFDNRTKHASPAFFMPSAKEEADRKNQATAMFSYLQDAHYVKQIPTYFYYDFTIEGWEYINSLKDRKYSSTAFIAMSFNEKNSILLEGEESIKAAIRAAGYAPMIIKDKEHNNFIMDEIIYEIKNSAFVVSDLTEQKNGVYFEAGYAKALGKEVIFTCHASDFKNRHFDIAQINTLKWTNATDLQQQLERKIQVTVGFRNKNL